MRVSYTSPGKPACRTRALAARPRVCRVLRHAWDTYSDVHSGLVAPHAETMWFRGRFCCLSSCPPLVRKWLTAVRGATAVVDLDGEFPVGTGSVLQWCTTRDSIFQGCCCHACCTCLLCMHVWASGPYHHAAVFLHTVRVGDGVRTGTRYRGVVHMYRLSGTSRG